MTDYSDYKNRSRAIAREAYWDEHDRDSYECPDCGRRESEIIGPFEVHHTSGEPMDNRPENHVALCRVCHNLREDKNPDKKRTQELRDHLNALMQDRSETDSEDSEDVCQQQIVEQFECKRNIAANIAISDLRRLDRKDGYSPKLTNNGLITEMLQYSLEGSKETRIAFNLGKYHSARLIVGELDNALENVADGDLPDRGELVSDFDEPDDWWSLAYEDTDNGGTKK